jgi:hypothetical protein
MRAFSWWSYLFAQVGGRLRPEPFWTTEGAEGLRLRAPGCVRDRHLTARNAAASGRRLSGAHQLPGPQLTVDAHDGALWAGKGVSLPPGGRRPRAEEVSASLTWACAGYWCEAWVDSTLRLGIALGW